MNQRQLECFIATAKLRSLSKAAQELYLTQPAVTYQIGSLERELGEPLFDRGANGMRLNEAGSAFMPTAQQIMRTISTATARFKARRPSASRKISVLHCQDINDCLWHGALAQYATEEPTVEVRTTCSLYKDEFDYPPADIYIIGRKNDETLYPSYTKCESLYQAWTHAIVPARLDLAAKKTVTLDDLRPYPIMLPPRDYIEQLDCWYRDALTADPDAYHLEFHAWRCSHEIQLAMFSADGVYISHGEHLNLAQDLTRIPFEAGTPWNETMICHIEDTDGGPIEDFVAFLHSYYQEHAAEFGPKDR